MGIQGYKTDYSKTIERLKKDQNAIVQKCYRFIKEVQGFQHCSKTIFPKEICDPGPFCECYYKPEAKWRIGDCGMADEFLRKSHINPKKKVRVGQQKQAK